VGEKHCSGRKNKLKKTDYKRSEQGIISKTTESDSDPFTTNISSSRLAFP